MTQCLIAPQFDPIAFSIGPISLHWYGVMYLLGVLFALWLGNRRIKRHEVSIKKSEFENLLFFGFIGIFICGRLGYVMFYNFAEFMANPLSLFYVWQGGMSFHGGLVGSLIVMLIFAKKTHRNFFVVADFVAPLIPVGLGAGRLGNFINGELWGRVTDSAVGMIFPHAKMADAMIVNANPSLVETFNLCHEALPRHPSQLYELALEGIVLFIILNLFIRKPRPMGSVSGLFLLFYGLFRFIIEFFREPDQQLGLFGQFISMGQILSLPMIIAGLAIVIWAYKANKVNI
ncbi:prolipoprotein diacylglyceryl transferase [Utexia brackfieldae]|uniref:prolipoprotein diacylglyceryl transferase n=1 Tax=Utexia brackfieldae TaxID=3074108 RepID=UPI00370D4544